MVTENRASETVKQGAEILNEGPYDPDRFTALIADDIRREDRRSGVADEAANGRDEYLGRLNAIMDLGVELNTWPTTVAVRGQHLAVMRNAIQFDNGFVMEHLQVTEVDEQGRLRHLILFDLDDEADALAELDRRWRSAT